MLHTNRNPLPDMTDALKKVYEDEKYGYDKDGNSKNPKDKVSAINSGGKLKPPS